jgi:hypothetical protein
MITEGLIYCGLFCYGVYTVLNTYNDIISICSKTEKDYNEEMNKQS